MSRHGRPCGPTCSSLPVTAPTLTNASVPHTTPRTPAVPTTEPPYWTGVWTTPACSAVEAVRCRGCPAFPTASPPTPHGGHTWRPDQIWLLSSPASSASTLEVKRRPGPPSYALSCRP